MLDGATWTRIIEGYVAGEIDDAPIAALAMACVIRGMGEDEIVALTDAMVRSGDVLDLGAGVVDKHSSGGVGDTVSLVAVPIAAVCGVPVAKLSGRALGHTGGTLDKLEAIPGVRTDLTPTEFAAQIERIGCAIAAQSERLVPADKKLYLLRDRTGTVPSMGLIAASIVSKKIAGGAGAIVFDVKTGNGAFTKTVEDGMTLARTLVRLSMRFGRRASALVSDMEQPLGAAIGSGLEAIEARDLMRGRVADPRLLEGVIAIAEEMLRVGGVPEAEISARADDALTSGAAYERFVAMIEAQGGTRAALEGLTPLPIGAHVAAPHDGYLTAIDAFALGEAARDLVMNEGAFAGLHLHARVGDAVRAGQRLADMHGTSIPLARVADAFTIGSTPPPVNSLIDGIVRDGDLLAVTSA